MNMQISNNVLTLITRQASDSIPHEYANFHLWMLDKVWVGGPALWVFQ